MILPSQFCSCDDVYLGASFKQSLIFSLFSSLRDPFSSLKTGWSTFSFGGQHIGSNDAVTSNSCGPCVRSDGPTIRMAEGSGQCDDVHVATTKRFVYPSLVRSNKLIIAAALLKDTVYIDGGYLAWIPGMADGSYGAATQDGKSISGHLLCKSSS